MTHSLYNPLQSVFPIIQGENSMKTPENDPQKLMKIPLISTFKSSKKFPLRISPQAKSTFHLRSTSLHPPFPPAFYYWIRRTRASINESERWIPSICCSRFASFPLKAEEKFKQSIVQKTSFWSLINSRRVDKIP